MAILGPTKELLSNPGRVDRRSEKVAHVDARVRLRNRYLAPRLARCRLGHAGILVAVRARRALEVRAAQRPRIEIDQARLLTLHTAHAMDTLGNKQSTKEIAMIKVVAPNMALNVIDRAIQVHGGAGVSQDFPLAYAWAAARTLRLADGPDEVHLESIAKQELEGQRRRQ